MWGCGTALGRLHELLEQISCGHVVQLIPGLQHTACPLCWMLSCIKGITACCCACH